MIDFLPPSQGSLCCCIYIIIIKTWSLFWIPFVSCYIFFIDSVWIELIVTWTARHNYKDTCKPFAYKNIVDSMISIFTNQNWHCNILTHCKENNIRWYIHYIKGILWDCRWSPASIRIFFHTCWFFYRNASAIHET